MKFISERNYFEPRARLLIQLGDKLIKNENIALLELIKNAYDADAKNVKIKLSRVHDKKNGTIEILDDGDGMDIDIINNAWLEPGSDNKAIKFKNRERTKKFKRLPIGEKGIGRFGVHKLGNNIELISKVKGGHEVYVNIDWVKFSQKKYLKDAKFEVYERTPEYFIGGRKGTRIIISNLRTAWDRRMVRELYRSVFSLNSPFNKKGKFSANIELDDPSLFEGLPSWEDVKEFSLFYFKATLSGSEIEEFTYKFTPWPSLTQVQERVVTEKEDFIINRSGLVRTVNKKEETINLGKDYSDGKNDNLRIGKVTLEGYIFDRDRSILELSQVQGKQLLKDYLDEQGGVRVYRGNLRVNEYGEKGNDWLGLDGRRVNTPAKRLSNNIILSTVELEDETSNALVEKTNREGFIENEAFFDLRDSVLYVLGIVEILREIDKDEIRRKYNPSEKKEPVVSKITQLKSFVNKKIKDKKTADDINNQLDKIETEYNEIQDILLVSAGAGLTLSVGMHEIHKIIEELIAAVVIEEIPDKITDLINHLDNLMKNYSDILKQSDTEELNLQNILKGAFFNNSYRLMSHEITTVDSYMSFAGDPTIKCTKRLLLGAITNIIDNSIFWLEKKYKRLKEIDKSYSKKIFVDIEENGDKDLEIIIADNGPGFDMPTDKLTKPFVSSKNDGMGLGLHIVSEIMKTFDGKIVFPEFGDYDLPEEFKRGAIVVLTIPKK
nr:ATP-binding protein [uncultured Draconibacterium sp.]